MRIALVINSLGVGGAERVLATLANHFAETGHAVTLITFDRDNDAVRQPLDPRVIPKRLGVAAADHNAFDTLVRLPLLLWRLRKVVRAFAPDRVISFMDQANILTLLALADSKVPVIVSERSDPARSSLMDLELPPRVIAALNWLRLRMYRSATELVIQTERAREFFPAALQPKITVIPNPVLPPVTGVTPDLTANVVVGVGRLVRQKRFDILIAAFQQVVEKFPDWKLLIFGHGPERTELNQLILDQKLSDRVLLPGPVLEPHQALMHGSIFVLSSESEGFPGALCEALAFGLPAIATSCRYGPEEIMSDERDGLLIPVNDPTALAQALTRLMGDPDRRRAMSLEAKRIVERFPLNKIAQRWLGVEPITVKQFEPPRAETEEILH